MCSKDLQIESSPIEVKPYYKAKLDIPKVISPFLWILILSFSPFEHHG